MQPDNAKPPRRERFLRKLKEVFTDLGLIAKFIAFCVVAWIGIEVGLWVHSARTNETKKQELERRFDRIGEGAEKVITGVNDAVVKVNTYLDQIGQNTAAATGEVAPTLREVRNGLMIISQQVAGIGSGVQSLAGTVRTEVRNRSEDFGRIEGAITNTVNSVNSKLNEQEVSGILANMLEASNGLKVIVNDPHIAQMLKNSAEITASMERTGKKLEVTVEKTNLMLETAQESNTNFKLFTDDFYKFSHKYFNPDPPKGFWQKLKRYTLEVLGYGRDGATVVRIYRDLTGPRY